MDVPELTDELIDRIAAQSDAQSGHLSIAELETLRDGNLVGMMRSLKARGAASGAVLVAHEAEITPGAPDLMAPMQTLERVVPPDWADQNNHMNEARYLQAISEACDRFLLWVGVTPDYVASGGSWFTVENHIRHLGEVRIGSRIRVVTQVLAGAGKKLHLFHSIHCGADLVATGEQMLLHVSLESRRVAPPAPEMATLIATIAKAHQDFAVPEAAGAAIGVK
jgi:carnitine 3-dehydrogenase / betainyl-CoA thioesterase